MHPLLSCESLVCHRPQWTKGRSSRVEDVSSAFETGTLTSFHGPDGCGKGLWLNLLGLLETLDSGTIRVILARALARRSEILVAITPSHDGELIFLVRVATREFGLCVLWADEAPISGVDGCFSLQSGRLHAAVLS